MKTCTGYGTLQHEKIVYEDFDGDGLLRSCPLCKVLKDIEILRNNIIRSGERLQVKCGHEKSEHFTEEDNVHPDIIGCYFFCLNCKAYKLKEKGKNET